MGLRESRAGQAVAVLAFVNAAIMLLRFSEQCILARSLGAGQQYDAYFIGQIVILLGGQLTVAVTSASVPILVDAGENAGLVARRLLMTTSLGMAAVCVVLAMLSAPIIQLLGGNLDKGSRLLARSILLWLTPATAGWIISSVLRGYWHAQRRFLVPGVGQLFIPLCTCASAVLLACKFWGIAYVAAAANAGALALVIVLYKPLLGSTSSGPWAAQNHSSSTRRFAASLVPVGVSLALMPGMIVVARSLAAKLAPGSVTGISLAASVASIPAQFAAASVGVVLLSQTAFLKSAGKMDEGARISERALCNTAFVVIPSAVVLMLWPREIVELVFQRGAFDRAAVSITASAMRGFSLGIPFQAEVQVLMFALFAFTGSRLLAVLSLLTLGVDVAVSRALLGEGVEGLASAFSLCSAINCAVLFWMLKAALPELQLRTLITNHARIFAMAVAAGAAAYLLEYVLVAPSLVKLMGVLTMYVAFYLGLSLMTGSKEMLEILNTARARIAGSPPVESLTAAE